MYINTLLWNDRTHLMNNTASSPRFSCSGCARTLSFNRSNKRSIGLKFRHLRLRLCTCLLQALLVCFQPHAMMRYLVPTSYRFWHVYVEEEPTEWLQFDTCTPLCLLEWLHLWCSCVWTGLSAFWYAYFRHI